MGRKGGNWRLDGLGHDPSNPNAAFRHRFGKNLPLPWGLTRRGYDPDEKAAALAKSLRNALDKRGGRLGHSLRKRTSYFLIILLAASAIGGGIYFKMESTGWTFSETLLHFAAYPNCDTARALGLAPAGRGQPGYYLQHDRDRDGIACEPYPRMKLRTQGFIPNIKPRTQNFISRMKSGDVAYTRKWQQHLKEEGLFDGEIDGVYGPQTEKALTLCAVRSRCLDLD